MIARHIESISVALADSAEIELKAELDKNPGWRRGWPDEEPLPQNPNLRYKSKVLDEVKLSLIGGGGDRTLASGADEVYLFAQGFTEEGAGKALADMGGTAYRVLRSPRLAL